MILSHPFRFTPAGDVAVVADGTEEAHAEAVAITVLTRKGERPLVPDFGVSDPTFDEVDLAELNVALADYGPPGVRVAAAEVTYPDDRTATVVITLEE